MFVYLKDILFGKNYKHRSNKWKYIIVLGIPKLLLKKSFFTIYQNEWKEQKNDNDKKIKKSTFHKNRAINNIEDINVNNILVSKKEPYGTKNSFKYFIGYNDNDIIRAISIRLPQMTGYGGKFDENAAMSFIVKDK